MSNVQVHFQPIVLHNFILSFLIKIAIYCYVITQIIIMKGYSPGASGENWVFPNDKNGRKMSTNLQLKMISIIIWEEYP